MDKSDKHIKIIPLNQFKERNILSDYDKHMLLFFFFLEMYEVRWGSWEDFQASDFLT